MSRAAGLGAPLVAAAFLAGCSAPPDDGVARPGPRPDRAQGGFLHDDARCAWCHAEIAATYAAHPMASAYGPLAGAGALAGAELPAERVHPVDGTRVRVVGDADGLRFEALAAVASGAVVDSLRAVSFVGAGRHSRAFVLERHGALVQAPLELYTASGTWDWAPGFERGGHPGLRRPVDRDCLGCHLTVVPPRVYPEDRLGDRLPERGIGCEGCHGPARRHVERRLAGEPVAAREIVRLGELSPSRQLDVCARCHLQGALRLPLVPEGARRFRPGQRLADLRATFVPAHPTAAFGFVSQVERLALSRCFAAGAWPVACTSCHDPHDAARPVDRRDACTSCHGELATLPAHAAGPDRPCAACHMRRSAPFDVRGVAVTDHWIRRRVPAPRETRRTRPRVAPASDLVPFTHAHDGGAAGASPAHATALRAMAWTALGEPRRALALFRTVERTAADDVRPYRYHLHRGRALAAAGRGREAEAAFALAWQDDPEDAPAGLELALTQLDRGALAAAEATLRAVLARWPELPEAWNDLALVLRAAGRPEAAVAALERSAAIDPDDARVWELLEELEADLGAAGRTRVPTGARREPPTPPPTAPTPR